MDKNKWKKISRILDHAITYPEDKRTTYIQNACGDDPDLLKEVEQLLASMAQFDENQNSLEDHLQQNGALISEVMGKGAETEEDLLKGKIIGRWVLNELIGRGGMGSVYKAQRTDESGIRQVGALKIIHNSLITPIHIERFKLEQQILSGLQHPNISVFIDSGITDDGIPYMVMEYVEGEPILDYCNNHNLSVERRLEIFKIICRTIQYAHKSLVVHRDLKPENILVTKDGHVKILDFGIAKLLDPNLYEGSAIETQPGMRLLSLEYASPEQISGQPVKTTTDLYSLGVLLYKLLTDLHPFNSDEFTYHEVEKMVLGQNPPSPSHRLASFPDAEKRDKIARERETESSELIKKLKGDLDAIIDKALRKDPERRFDSVESLLNDLERHQKGIPILARPDTTGYRARKFIYRHRWGVSAVALVILTLMMGLVTTLWQARQAQQNAQQAELQAQRAGEVTDFLVELFDAGDPGVAQGTEISISELLERGVEKALEPGQDAQLQMNMLAALGRVYLSLGKYDKSVELLEQALEMAGKEQTDDHLLLTADIQTRLGLNFRFMGNLAMADSLHRMALENRKNVLGEGHPLTISSMDYWAGIQVYRSHDVELADSLFQDVLTRRRSVLDSYDEDLAESLNNLGYIKTRKGEFEEALKLYEEASEIYRVVLGEHHPTRIHVMSSIAYLYHKLGDLENSEKMRRETIEIRRRVLGEEHPHLALSYHYLAELLLDAGRPEEALENSRKAVEIIQNSVTSQPSYPDMLILLARIYHILDDVTSAAETYRLASERCTELRGVTSPSCFRLNRSIGEFFIEQQQLAEATAYIQKSYDAMLQTYEPGHSELLGIEELMKKL